MTRSRLLLGAATIVIGLVIGLLVNLIPGGSSKAPSGAKRTLAYGGHQCSPTNTFMQCALANQRPPTPPRTLSSSGSSAFGLDFGWGGPSCSAMHAVGASFASSYLSYDSSKNWQRWQVDEYHRCGIATTAVWETSASRATQGKAAGYSDAIEARRQAANLGMLASRSDWTITFAIDADVSGGSVDSYFRGADAAIGTQHVDAYGGYYPLGYLCSNHLVSGRSWQTYAWSGGRWLSAGCAPLEQYNNSHQVGGKDTDYNRSIAADYGQWPYAQAPPPDPHGFHYYSTGPFNSPWGKLNEQLIAERYVGAIQHPQKYAAHIRFLRKECDYLANRLWTVAHRDRVVNWDKWDRGFRHYHMRLCAQGKKI